MHRCSAKTAAVDFSWGLSVQRNTSFSFSSAALFSSSTSLSSFAVKKCAMPRCRQCRTPAAAASTRGTFGSSKRRPRCAKHNNFTHEECSLSFFLFLIAAIPFSSLLAQLHLQRRRPCAGRSSETVARFDWRKQASKLALGTFRSIEEHGRLLDW